MVVIARGSAVLLPREEDRSFAREVCPPPRGLGLASEVGPTGATRFPSSGQPTSGPPRLSSSRTEYRSRELTAAAGQTETSSRADLDGSKLLDAAGSRELRRVDAASSLQIDAPMKIDARVRVSPFASRRVTVR